MSENEVCGGGGQCDGCAITSMHCARLKCNNNNKTTHDSRKRSTQEVALYFTPLPTGQPACKLYKSLLWPAQQ